MGRQQGYPDSRLLQSYLLLLLCKLLLCKMLLSKLLWCWMVKVVSPLFPGLPSPTSSFPPSHVGKAFFLLALPVRASICCCSGCLWLWTAEETVLLFTPYCLKNQLGPNPPCYTVLVQLQDLSRERRECLLAGPWGVCGGG